MSIKESALSAITSIAQNDFIRVVTADGASRRVSLANLANAINSKTFITLTKSTSVDTFECYTYKYGSLFTGYIIFKPNTDIADDGEIVTAGVPALIAAMQLPVTCVAGTQAGQTGRCRITNGKIVNWYSAMSIKAGNTYLIPVSAICA